MNGDKSRRALGDLTNQSVKRDFSSILHRAGSKTSISGDVDPRSAKHVCLGVENSIRDSGIENPVSSTEKLGFGNNTTSDFYREAKMPNALELDRNDEEEDAVQVEDVSSQKCCDVPNHALDLVKNMFVAKDAQIESPNLSDEELNLKDNNDEAIEVHEVVRLDDSSKGSSEGNVKNLELTRCKLLKDSEITDPLNGCSCSFCLKASYIWSDLHFRDIKGRISALKKSQKEATTLVQRCTKPKDFTAGSSSGPSKLENDLMNQWRSLFLHMEGVLTNENNQLQANYTALTDIRERCRIDLESINKRPEE